MNEPNLAKAVSTSAYAPSWLDRLLSKLRRLPGPTWLGYLAIAVIGVIAGNVPAWSRGDTPFGVPVVEGTYWGLLPVTVLVIAAYIRQLAEDSFDTFRPALTTTDTESEKLRYRLIVLPSKPSLAITAAAVVLTAPSLAFDAEGSGIVGVPWPAIAVVFAVQAFVSSVLFLLLFGLLRQMGLIRRTLADSVTINVFRPEPLQAFANLTARPGALLTILVASAAFIQPLPTDVEAFLAGWAPYFFVPPIIAVVAFVAPLAGLHRQLAAQKRQLQDRASQQLQSIVEKLAEDVDSGGLSRIEKLHAAQGSLIAQRELLDKLPTWPWSAATLRGFVSAIFLPSLLFLVQQLADTIFQ